MTNSNIEKKHTKLMDIPFEPLNDEAINIIRINHNALLKASFIRRLIYSIVISVVIIIAEVIGRTNAHRTNTIIGMIIFVIVVLIIFNLLSYGFIVLKKNIDDLKNHSSFTYATISQIFDSHTLEKNNKTKSNNFILFETDKYHCETALPVSNYKLFTSFNVDDEVIIVKYIPFGEASYEVFKRI